MRYNSEKILIGRAIIETPLAFVDFSLPARFSRFGISASGIRIDEGNFTEELLCAALSFDGESYWFDNDNYGAYGHTGIEINGTTLGVVAADHLSFGDAVADLNLWKAAYGAGITTADGHLDFEATLFPGNDSLNAIMQLRTAVNRSDMDDTITGMIVSYPPVKARAKRIMFFGYGNGDAPPTATGHELLAGTFEIWGIP